MKDGESIAIHYLSKGLVASGCKVDLLALKTLKHNVSYTESPPELSHYASTSYVEIDTTPRYLPALKSLFSGSSYNIERFHSPAMEEKLRRTLEQKSYDVVQLETLYLLPYVPTIRKYSSAIIALRSHNIEGEIWRGLARKEGSALKRWYYNLSASRLLSCEKSLQGHIDCLIPLSDVDAETYKKFGYEDRMLTVPIGLDLEHYAQEARGLSEGTVKLGFIGSMDWRPNQEGIDWFVREVKDDLFLEFPQIEFHLAGRNMPASYKALSSKNFIVHGEVEDALEFTTALDIICVPLFSGSGVKVKILEAMAMCKLVISTAKGFEGIDLVDKENAFLYESKEDFINAVRMILNADPAVVLKVQRASRKTIVRSYDYVSIAQNLQSHYRDQINELI